MRVIPVIDLMNGEVVRGVAGRRSEYRPIESLIAADARPATVARAFVERFGFDTVYVADLDAIQNGKPNTNGWQPIAGAGLQLWLDAGVGNASAARRVLDKIAALEIDARLIIGLESLESMDALAEICALCSPDLPVFSLDMKEGLLLTRNTSLEKLPPMEIVSKAASAGIQEMVVLDLADVGTAQGTRTSELCLAIRESTRIQTVIAGGGVRGLDDLDTLSRAGCDAALVASALHDGRLSSDEVRRAGSLSY